MEYLLDEADELARSSDEPSRPDFIIPEEYMNDQSLMELKETKSMGKGWFAQMDLPAGTRLLVAKPIAMVMDWQDIEDEEAQDSMDDDDENGGDKDDPHLNALLLLQILEELHYVPALWFEELDELYPRTSDDLANLKPWVCHDDDLFMKVEAAIEKLDATMLPVKDISHRLPLILRYNILSIETCPELLSYPGPEGHMNLSGVGLYHQPSFFNHSAKPNCSRWCIGDILVVVTNQDVASGAELCISYIEHDVLCETSYRRNQMLRMNFLDGDATPVAGPDVPVVDAVVQNELMAMDPFARLPAIDELNELAHGRKGPEEAEVPQDDDDTMDVSRAHWFQCDIQNLRILKAITLESMGQSKEALSLWEECVKFCETSLPPNDESSVVAHVQSAMCAFQCGRKSQAKTHAASALRTHDLLFGGGVELFRRRLAPDLRLRLRPGATDESTVDALWPTSS